MAKLLHIANSDYRRQRLSQAEYPWWQVSLTTTYDAEAAAKLGFDHTQRYLKPDALVWHQRINSLAVQLESQAKRHNLWRRLGYSQPVSHSSYAKAVEDRGLYYVVLAPHWAAYEAARITTTVVNLSMQHLLKCDSQSEANTVAGYINNLAIELVWNLEIAIPDS